MAAEENFERGAIGGAGAPNEVAIGIAGFGRRKPRVVQERQRRRESGLDRVVTSRWTVTSFHGHDDPLSRSRRWKLGRKIVS
jgi:hypothetical protein